MAQKKTSKTTLKDSKKKTLDSLPALEAHENHSRLFTDFSGLFLILLGLISLASLIADFGRTGEEHLFGPYLGNWLSINLRRVFGKLPVFLSLLWTVCLGFRFLGLDWKWNSSRNLFFAFLVQLQLMILLSVKMLNLDGYHLEDFENTGGVLGNFLVHFLLQPIVHDKIAGAYLIDASVLVFTMVWGFNLNPKELLTTLLSLRSEHFERKQEQKKFENEDLEPPRGEKIESVRHRKRPVEILDQDEAVDFPENIPGEVLADPRRLRQWRDEQAEVERYRRVNEWEDHYGLKDPEIAGIVQAVPPPPPLKEEKIRSPRSVDTAKTQKMPRVQANRSDRSEIDQSKSRNIYEQYQVPKVDGVFPEVPEQILDLTPDQLRSQAAHLEAQLANFGVKGKVVNVTTGPVITRFEIDLAPGVKLSRVAGLGDDLALSLRAKSVRVLAPIPGKSAVGIEIPNQKSQVVYCREVLFSPEFKVAPDQIIIGLGKDIAGRPYVMDMATAPHMLIAGQTGSGKSVCINMLMASLLCSKTPDELRLLLVDPKVVELKPYENIPHLLAPVITKPEIAVQALSWACWEMDRRYEVLARARVRNIAGFNQKFMDNQLVDLVDAEDNKRLPYLVIVVDEFADLMMVAGKQVEVAIARIAQKARAVGIHLVLATQRPSTNVITGVIKANLPTRIAFKVASQIDARTIMDKAGSEKLLGRGDMLFRSVNDPEPTRVHGAFLTDQEVEVLAKACSDQNVHYPHLDSFDFEGNGQSDEDRDVGPRDEKFAEAAEMVVTVGQASTSFLQRRMQLGYARAGRIMDQLESAGVVGKDRGAKGREIIMDEEELRSFLSGSIDRGFDD